MSDHDRQKSQTQEEERQQETPEPQRQPVPPSNAAAQPPAAPPEDPSWFDQFSSGGELKRPGGAFEVFDFNFGGLLGMEGDQAEQLGKNQRNNPWESNPRFGGTDGFGWRQGGGFGLNWGSSTTESTPLRELDAFDGWDAGRFAEFDGIGPVRSESLANGLEGRNDLSELDDLYQVGPATLDRLQGTVDEHRANTVVETTNSNRYGAGMGNDGTFRAGYVNQTGTTMGNGDTSGVRNAYGVGANRDGVAAGYNHERTATTGTEDGDLATTRGVGFNGHVGRDGSYMLGMTTAYENQLTDHDGNVTDRTKVDAGLSLGQSANGDLQGAGNLMVTTEDRGRTGVGFSHTTDSDGYTTTGGQIAYDGNGLMGGVVTDEDGNIVGGNAGAIYNDVGGQATVIMDDTRTRVDVQGGNGVVTGNLSFDNIDGGEIGGVEGAGNGTAANRLLGGNVITAGTQDRTSFQAGAQYGVFSAQGGVNSSSSVEALAAAPDNMTPEQLEQWQEEQRQDLPESISDVDFDALQNGEGYRFRSGNGWNLGGGAGYGVVGVSGSYASSSAHEVTLAQDDNGQLQVNLRSTEADETKVGANIAGVIGLEGQFNGEDVSEYGFSVDPENEEAMAAFQEFAETGVLPGARSIESEGAVQATADYDSATAEVDRINEQLANATDPHEMQALAIQLDAANGRINTARDALNAEWRANNGATSSPVPGITVNRTSNETMEGEGLNVTSALGDANLASTSRRRIDTEEMNSEGGIDHTYEGIVETSGVFMQDETFSIAATDANDPLAIRMTSQGVLTEDAEASTLRNLDESQRNVSDDRLTAMENQRWFDGINGTQDVYEDMTGVTTVNLTTEDFTAIGDALNEGEGAEELWSGLASSSAQLFEQPEPISDGQGGTHTPPPGYVTEGMSLPDGMTREQVQTTLASMQGPEDFQALEPEMQSVAVDAMVNAYRQGGSPYQALAAINLVEDPAERARLTREMFVDAQGENLGGHTDPVLAFVDFANSVDNPDVAEAVSNATQFQLTNTAVTEAMQLSQDDRATQFGEAFQQDQGGFLEMRGTDSDTGRQFELLEASSNVGGPQEVLAMLDAAGVDPVAAFDEFDGDGFRQREFLEMLGDSPAAEQLRADQGRMDAMEHDYQEDLEGNDFFDMDQRENGDASASLMNGLIESHYDASTGDTTTEAFGGFIQNVDNHEELYYERTIGGENGLSTQIDIDDLSGGFNAGGENGFGLRYDDGNIDMNWFGTEVDVDEAVGEAWDATTEFVSDTWDSATETVGNLASSAWDAVTGW